MFKISSVKKRLKNKLSAIDFAKSIKNFDCIEMKHYKKRCILRLNTKLKTHLDWEQAMLEIEENLPPSLSVGDNGFIVDLSEYSCRTQTEFSGVYIIANDPFTIKSNYLDVLDEAYYLTLYLKGDHEDARLKYFEMIDYAKEHKLILGNHAYERMLIDNFLSSDDELHIMEIQIPVKEMRHNERFDTR